MVWYGMVWHAWWVFGTWYRLVEGGAPQADQVVVPGHKNSIISHTESQAVQGRTNNDDRRFTVMLVGFEGALIAMGQDRLQEDKERHEEAFEMGHPKVAPRIFATLGERIRWFDHSREDSG